MNNIYEFKGKQYRIFAESKMKIDGEWIDCIIYQTLYFNKDGWIWVRNSEEFFKLFKKVDETLSILYINDGDKFCY